MKHDTDKLCVRLSRIEGQIRGVKTMVEENRECEDIIIQLSAINSAVSNLAKIIMTEHIEHCVINGIKNGDEETTVAGLKKALDQFVKMK